VAITNVVFNFSESLGCLSGTFLKDAIARMRKARPGMVDESSGRFRNDRE